MHNCPEYLNKFLIDFNPTTNVQLRSQSQGPTLEDSGPKNKWAMRCFTHAGPKLYNSLPTEIKNQVNINSFKDLLKTHLFTNAYNLVEQSVTGSYSTR